MIPLQNQLFPGEFVHKGKVRLGCFQAHRPAQVAHQHSQIIRSKRLEAFAEFLRMLFPHLAEAIHRLFTVQGQMQIADCIKCHQFAPLLKCVFQMNDPDRTVYTVRRIDFQYVKTRLQILCPTVPGQVVRSGKA